MSTAAGRPKTWDGVASCVLGVVCLGMLAAWVPQYLSWPWWTDLDHFATFAMAWDVGVLPYRDLPTFQLPGEYYLFWVIGKVFGWGRTAPVYAVDAAAVVGLGAGMVAWSRRRFGRSLPGVVGYGGFLCYYLGLGIHQVAQRDWHSALLATLGLFAAEVVPGRRGRIASALALASAMAIRPHVVLLVPAFLLAIDESARPTGGPWSLTRRAVVEWGLLVCVFFALAFAPLVVAGTFDDFVRGLGEAAPGSSYNRLTPSTLVARMTDQFRAHRLVLAVAVAAALLAAFGVPGRRRAALTWLAALAGAWLYKPLSPVAHVYLIHTLILVASVVSAVLVGMILEVPGWPCAIRAALVTAVVAAGFANWPRYVSASRAWHALTAEKAVEFPRMPPDCGPMYLFYTWEEYRSTVIYLRRTVPADVRLANALRGLPALTAPVARLSAFPEVSLSWFEARIRRPGLEEAYIRSLRETPRSVVVWRPGEESAPDSFMPRRLLAYVRSAYTFEARFGTIEVWRRRPGT